MLKNEIRNYIHSEDFSKSSIYSFVHQSINKQQGKTYEFKAKKNSIKKKLIVIIIIRRRRGRSFKLTPNAHLKIDHLKSF